LRAIFLIFCYSFGKKIWRDKRYRSELLPACYEVRKVIFPRSVFKKESCVIVRKGLNVKTHVNVDLNLVYMVLEDSQVYMLVFTVWFVDAVFVKTRPNNRLKDVVGLKINQFDCFFTFLSVKEAHRDTFEGVVVNDS
jgi:hypothetical protein